MYCKENFDKSHKKMEFRHNVPVKFFDDIIWTKRILCRQGKSVVVQHDVAYVIIERKRKTFIV